MRLMRLCVKAPRASETARRAAGAAGFGSGSRWGVKLQVVDRIGKACGCSQSAHEAAECFIPRRNWCLSDINGVLVAKCKISGEEQRVWFGQVQHIDEMLLALDLGVTNHATRDGLILFPQDKNALGVRPDKR